MALALTYKKLLNLLQDFAASHRQINTFTAGDVFSYDLDKFTDGVFMGVSIPTSSVRTGTYTYTLSALFMDILTTGDENQTDVISDCELIALDFVAYLDKYDQELFILDRDNISIDFMYDERHGSKYGGVIANIPLSTAYDFDYCSVPFAPGLTWENWNDEWENLTDNWQNYK